MDIRIMSIILNLFFPFLFFYIIFRLWTSRKSESSLGDRVFEFLNIEEIFHFLAPAFATSTIYSIYMMIRQSAAIDFETDSWVLIPMIVAGVLCLVYGYYFNAKVAVLLGLVQIIFQFYMSAGIAFENADMAKHIPSYFIWLSGLISVALSLVSQLHRKYFNDFELFYKFFSLVGITGLLFALSFEEPLRELAGMEGKVYFTIPPSVPAIAGLMVLISMICFLFYQLEVLKLLKTLYVSLLLAFFVLITLSSFPQLLSGAFTLFLILFNIAIFAEFLYIIFVGYMRKVNGFINVGVYGLLALIVIKYFYWFFEILDVGLFFMSAGITILGLGFLLDKFRRKLVKELKA